MLGGSAPSQTPGAPYRTESECRSPAAWPSSAHPNNRGYGVYSLFPGPGDTPGTLYTPTAKNNSNSFQDYVGTQKVSGELFPAKYTYISSGAPRFDSSAQLRLECEAPQRESTATNFKLVSKPFSPTSKKSEEEQIIFGGGKESAKPKGFSNGVLLIKTEVEEGSKAQVGNLNVVNGQSGTEVDVLRNNNERPRSESESGKIKVGDVLSSEPDSTEFKILNETTEDVRISERDTSEKELVSSGTEVGLCRSNPTDCPDNKEIIGNYNQMEKCNIKVIDSAAECVVSKNKKKTEKYSVKVESVNEICSRLSERKFPSAKTSEINCRIFSGANKKVYNERSKISPIRTLSLSPQNGGCSRTTPVTFRHTPQPEADPKPQNLHIEVPPLFIKKEPSEFHKNSNGTPFLSPPNLDNNFFSPGGLNVLDGHPLSPIPFPTSFESSNRQKQSFLSPLDQNFLSPGQTFLSPRPLVDSPFLSPASDFARYNAYKNYHTLPKISGNYLLNGSDGKISEGVFLKRPDTEDRQTEESRVFINSTTAEGDSRSRTSENVAVGGSTPCQVAEVTSASSLLSPKHSNVNPLVVKQESTSVASRSGSSVTAASVEQSKETGFVTSGQSTLVSSTVGVPSTRQRCQQRVTEVEMPPANGFSSAPPQAVPHKAINSPSSIDVSPAIGAAVFAKGLIDDRSANLITTWPAQAHHNPPLWQYSAPIDYPPFPPVGLQLVRDPVTGHFLLIPSSNLEALQRAILWPTFQTTTTTPQMIIPPLSVQPSTPHLVLDTNVPAVDFLTPDSIHHGAQQHRILISSDNSSKRKITTPTVIKLETSDCPDPVVACDNNNIYTKTQPPCQSPRREPVFHSQKTLSSVETGRRSQATSPCLTPVLESLSNQSDSRDSDSCQALRTTTVTLQDASNQTDLPFESKSEEYTSVPSRDKFMPYTRTTGRDIKMTKTQDVGTETVLMSEPEDDKSSVVREIQKQKEVEESLKISLLNMPDPLNIKKEMVSPSQVDLSGLELLSNSIEQFISDVKCPKTDVESKNGVKTVEERKDLSSDACEGAVLLQNLRNGFREMEKKETYEIETSKNLGGLGLLCALAEQRFQEEIGKETVNKENETTEDDECSKEESKRVSSNLDYLKEKDFNDCDMDNSQSNHQKDIPILKKEVETINDENKTPKVNKKILNKEDYKKGETDSVNDSEKVTIRRKRGRPKKFRNFKKDNSVLKSFFYGKPHRNSKEMSPPILEKETDFSFDDKTDLQDSILSNSKEDILKPPTLTPSTILDPVIKTMAGTLELSPCEVNLIALKLNGEKLKTTEKEDASQIEGDAKKRKFPDDDLSSSKKRKVGRPKKHNLLHENSLTETIVAKKPKAKPYLFQPVQPVESLDCSNRIIEEKSEKRKNSVVKAEGEEMAISDVGEDEEKKSKKIKPKLKAEPKVKEWTGVQEEENAERKTATKKDECFKQKLRISKKVVTEGEKSNSGMNGMKESKLPNCTLTTDHLNSDRFPIRTLTGMGGLFYAGQLSAIRAPDVYGITIDGERGNRPHIYSREEILKDSILEVKMDKTSNLPPGTRCCAYWSEQYRCLYPGTIAVPASPDSDLDDKFVNVEFDDGDSGKINIDDVRLLPEDYPIVEYDPNPLQSLSKRKRRISGASVESHSKDRKSIESMGSPEKKENGDGKSESGNEETEPKKLAREAKDLLSLESERRHLKKKRRDKLKRLQSLSIEGKKKHKKHKCSDRHHRHHKKHRKHKHKHGKRHEGEGSGEEASQATNKDKEESTGRKICKSKCKSVENSCKMSDKSKAIKPKKCKKRTDSVESSSKMAAFLPARQLWGWSGKGFRRPGAKGRARKEFYKTIQRGKERIMVGDCAVFLSTGRPDRPYIGRIESMWESWGTNMIVRVKWFYHPEETVGCPATLEYPGALFESPHVDENDVQTISHKCEVLPLKEYTAKIGNDPQKYETIYDNNDIYYLAGYYDPTNTTLKMEPGVK